MPMSTGAKYTRVECRVNNSPIHNHTNGSDYLSYELDDNQWIAVECIHYITLTSPSTIDLNINYSDYNYGTAKISNARIEIIRVE